MPHIDLQNKNINLSAFLLAVEALDFEFNQTLPFSIDK